MKMKNVILTYGNKSVAVQIKRRTKTAVFEFFEGTEFQLSKTYECLDNASREWSKLVADGYQEKVPFAEGFGSFNGAV